MRKIKTLVSTAMKAMLIAGFAAIAYPTTAMAAGVSVQAVNQQEQVKGTVVDETGEPMIGVTVKVKGSTTGAITDLDGNFTLNAPAGSVIEISYVGYTTQSIKAVAGKAINVKMQPDAKVMDEVVVIGYGTVKKRDMLGAISQVKSDDIKQSPTMNAMEGLQGKISGLDITRTSGAAGSDPKILLRGNRSLDGSNDPLFVIDGISGGNINNLNPNDIESIEVLKDASSTAIYGSAGANGVIIVTTKQGDKGKVSVDFNAFCGINAFPAYPKTYTGEAWLDYLNAGFEGYYGKTVYEVEGIDPNSEGAYTKYIDRLFNERGVPNAAKDAYNAGKFINWKDEILKTGVQQNYNVSVRGGSEKLTGYMSLGYMNEKGIYRKDNYNQINFRSGGTFQLNKMINFGFQATVTHKDRDRRNSRLSKILNAAPVGEIYDELGNLRKYVIDEPIASYVNIMADDIPGAYSNNIKSTSLNISPYVEIKPIKGLSYKSLFNAGVSTSRNALWDGFNTYMKLTGSQDNIRKSSKTHNDSWSIQWQNILNYGFKIKDIHDISVTGIMEYNRSISESTYAYAQEFEFDSYTWNSLGSGTNSKVTSSYIQKRMLSYAARVNYNLLGKYLFSATMRWDGASQLYNKWDSFPSVSFGWRVSDEAFMEGTRDWLDNLKLRVGYGITGNSNIPAYSSLTLSEDPGNKSQVYLNLGGGRVQEYILAQAVANYSLGWEKSYNLNIGLDFGFFGGRIDGSLEYYNTDTKGVLYKRPLPSVYGNYNAKANYTMMSNIARVKNHGVELTLNTRNIIKKDFQWTSTFTFAKNVEKLVSIDLGNNVSVDDLVALNLFMRNPIHTYYGYKKEGIWQKDQADMAACFGLFPGQVHLATPTLTWDPSYTYTGYVQDRISNEYTSVERHGAYYGINEDGEKVYYRQGTPVVGADGKTTIEGENLYSPNANNDKMILGHATPDFTIGFHNNFTWKNFDLAIQTVMRWGFMTNGDLLGYANATNQPTSFDYWTPNHATNAFPLASLGVSSQAKEAMLYVDGSFIKVKNITLGYNLPKNTLRSINMSKLRVYATVQNPFIWAKSGMLKGLDPENTSTDFPLYKTIVIGINASF